jgi:hypothetical protein
MHAAWERLEELVRRDPASHVSLTSPDALTTLLRLLNWSGVEGTQEQVGKLASRAALHVPLDDPVAIKKLMDRLWALNAWEQYHALRDRIAAASIPLDQPLAVAELLSHLRVSIIEKQITTLADHAAAHIPLDDPATTDQLLGSLGAAGATNHVAMLLQRDPAAHVGVDNKRGTADVLERLQRLGEPAQVAKLARRAAELTSLDDQPYAVDRLLGTLQKAGAHDQCGHTATLHWAVRDGAEDLSTWQQER